MIKSIVFATGNRHKLREAGEIFPDLSFQPVDDVLTVFDPVEDGATFMQNAVKKAECAISAGVKQPVMADDSGIVVPALDNAPGIYSARYAGKQATDRDNRLKLLRELDDCVERQAHFVCVMVLLRPDYTAVITRGTCHGSIAREESGTGGFGYDPVFIPDGHRRTLAELSSEEKHRLSHRGAALRNMREQLTCLHG